jgi:hypothetical protein
LNSRRYAAAGTARKVIAVAAGAVCVAATLLWGNSAVSMLALLIGMCVVGIVGHML